MKFIQVPAGFSLELFASEPDIVKPISFTFDERGRLWVIEAIDYPNDVRNGEPGDDRIKIVEDTDGDGKADKFTVFADDLNLADEPDVRQRRRRSSSAAPHMLFLKDTDGDGKADVRQILSTGWGIRDTHAGPSNLQYGPDNYIWGSVGYSGFDGEMNGKKLQFTQGTYRFKPDGSGFEYMTMSTNNTWGLGFYRDLRRLRLDGEQRSQLPRRDSEPVLRRRRGPAARRAAAVRAIRVPRSSTPRTTRRRTSGRWTCSGGYTAGGRPLSLHRALVPEGVLEPHRLHHRANRAHRRSGHHRVAGRRLRDARRLEPALGRRGMGRAGARAGGARRRGLGLRLVQLHRAAQSDADGLRERRAATPTSSRCAITRAAASIASSTSTRRRQRSDRCPTTDRAGLLEALASDNMFWRLHAQRLLVERGQKDVVPQLSRSCATRRSTRSGPTAARSTRSGRCRAWARSTNPASEGYRAAVEALEASGSGRAKGGGHGPAEDARGCGRHRRRGGAAGSGSPHAPGRRPCHRGDAVVSGDWTGAVCGREETGELR